MFNTYYLGCNILSDVRGVCFGSTILSIKKITIITSNVYLNFPSTLILMVSYTYMHTVTYCYTLTQNLTGGNYHTTESKTDWLHTEGHKHSLGVGPATWSLSETIKYFPGIFQNSKVK